MLSDDEELGIMDQDDEKKDKKKRKDKVFLEYVILFSNTNIINLEKVAMGGLDYRECEWWIEMETFQTFMFNVWRYNLQNLCIGSETER